jgi:regulator of sirC expression with transglutaminase-like and TPR domain
MTDKEINALITLLDDPDKDIYQAISKTLLDKGIEIVPDLEKAWENSSASSVQDRIESIIQKIQLNHIHKSLTMWLNNGANDLLEGAFIIAKYQYPDLGFYEVINTIEKIKQDVWLEISDNLTALEKVRVINHILFDIHKFSANNSNYYSPQNSYINQVLQSKKGNPISLSIVYAVIAQKLGLPVYGVNLPKNFILAYKDEYHDLFPSGDEVLFYINPFNKGAVLGRKEIDVFLKQQNITPEESFYTPCSNIDIIQRVIMNLIYSYEKLGYENKVKDLNSLMKLTRLNNHR